VFALGVPTSSRKISRHLPMVESFAGHLILTGRTFTIFIKIMVKVTTNTKKPHTSWIIKSPLINTSS